MDSSLLDNCNTSVIADAIDVNSGKFLNTLSIGIYGSASCLVVSDESDVSFSDSINHFNLKRKYGSEIRNGSLSEEDDSVSILKLCKLNHIPLLVQPIRSVKASEYETAASPGSVLEPLPIAMFPVEDLEDDSEDNPRIKSFRQFWEAADYEVNFNHDHILSSAFAELLDSSLDEVCNGAAYNNIDMLIKEKDGSRMLVIEDEYHKTWRRLSCVFSVAMEVINEVQAHYFLILKFNFVKDRGTSIIICNLWEDDVGHLELDFDADSHDMLQSMLTSNKGGSCQLQNSITLSNPKTEPNDIAQYNP